MESSNIPAQNVANEEPIGRKESNMTAANKNIIGWVDKSTPSSELGLWRNLNVHQSFQDSELHDTTNSKSNVSMASTTNGNSCAIKSPNKKRSPNKKNVGNRSHHHHHHNHPLSHLNANRIGFIELGDDSELSSFECSSSNEDINRKNNVSSNALLPPTASTTLSSAELSSDSCSSTSQSDELSDYSNDSDLPCYNAKTNRPFIGLADAGTLDLNINRPTRNIPNFNPYRVTDCNNGRYFNSPNYVLSGTTPWMPANRQYSRGVIGLHEEILDFYHYILPTQAEIEARKNVIQRLEYLIKKRWPLATVTVFGSFRTGLILPTSDLDIVVTGRWKKFPLFSMAEELIRAKVSKERNTTVLAYATVPLVKYIDEETNIKVDISFNVKDGEAAFALVNEFKIKYLAMDKLVLILKLFLANRKMNEVFSGGLSSYSLTMLVVNFFQMHERPDARNPDTNLGVLLLEFFELYGCRFNYNRVGIRIRNDGEYVPKEMLRRQIGSNSSSLLCLEDPICRTNELSRSTFAMPAIQSAFESAFSRLNFECGYGGLTRFKHDQVPSLLGLIVRVPDSMIAFRKHIQNLYTNKNQSLSPANKNPYNNRLSSSQSLQSFDSKQHLHRTHLHLSRPPTLLRQPNGRQETNTAHNSHNNYSNINTQKHYNHQRSLQSIQTEKIQSKFSTNRSRADASYDFDPELISIGSNDSNEDDLITTESDSEEDDMKDSKIELIRSANRKRRKDNANQK